jgi:hypothetical protein
MPRMTPPPRMWTLALALAGALFGCHQCGHGDDVGWDSDLVGGGCGQDRDCVERCIEGGEFPGGTCTVSCDHDDECPQYTACMEKEGGVCLLMCDHKDACSPDYDCRDIDRHGEGGKTRVCIH